jgi:hypothetical protein
MFDAIPTKVPMTFITEIEKNYPKVHLETQKTMNSQGNTEQKEQCLRNHNIRLQTILRSNKNSMVVAQKRDMKTSGTAYRPHI